MERDQSTVNTTGICVGPRGLDGGSTRPTCLREFALARTTAGVAGSGSEAGAGACTKLWVA